jgi:hypothetical protein
MSTPAQSPAPPDLMFANMKGTKSEAIQATERLKIAVLGEPGTGKSWFAATAPGPVRYYDFDDRSESLEGKPNLFILSKPTMLDIESDISMFKANKMKKIPLPATLVFDSVTFMVRAMEDEIRRQQAGLFKSIRIGNTTSVYKGKDWDVVVGIQRYMEYLIGELTSLGCNFIFVFHEKDEKDKAESTVNDTKYTGHVTTDPQYLSNILSLFNEVYRITVDASKPNQINYRVTCRPNNEMMAKTTLLLDQTEMPDIMAMIAKHKAKRAALTPKV